MKDQPPARDPVAAAAAPPTPKRRGFMAALAAIVTGGVITLTPLVAGAVFSLDPLRRKRAKFLGANQNGFLRVTELNKLPADGAPERFTIKADLIDAWNLFKDRTIGTIYLRKVGDNVLAFTDVCPHLGCKINYQSSSHHFFCPCHASTFDLDGTKINQIPPRNMDSLDVKVDPDGSVWVKYEDFRGGVEEKIPT